MEMRYPTDHYCKKIRLQVDGSDKDPSKDCGSGEGLGLGFRV
jgi:hypothetical protein